MSHVLCILCLLLAPVADDAKDLAGTWKATSYIIDGDTVPADVAKMLKVIIKGDTLTLHGGLAQAGGRYIPTATATSYKMKLGTNNGMKTIDLSPTRGNGKAIRGIYKLEDGKLTLCLGLTGKRPGAFASGANSATSLSTCEKE
jgi:uncharacterized protein (TIGR03067 family)